MDLIRLEQFRQTLLNLRERVATGAGHMVESIQAASPDENISAAPVHLADAAAEALDANVTVLENERVLQELIDAALRRIEDKSFGICRRCEAEIDPQRLEALPYAPVCIVCAQVVGEDLEDYGNKESRS